jgi:hypothetical protein
MDCDDASRRVDDGTIQFARTPYEPIVEARAADQEGGHRVEKAPPEDEVIECRVPTKASAVESALVQPGADGGIAQPRSCRDVEVAALSDEEKVTERGIGALDRREEVVEEKDVGVDEAPQRPPRNGRRTLERAVETRCAAHVSRKPANVLDSGRSSALSHSLLVTDKDDLDVVSKREPAFDRVPLDIADAATKRLRHREDREHAREGTGSLGASRGSSTIPVVAKRGSR